jgi:hypothetical protein
MCAPLGVLLGGPTEQQTAEANAQQQYTQTIQGNYSKLFNQQQLVDSNLNNLLTPIAEAGPNQSGMSAAELAAQNTQALDTTGANYANAARTVGNQLAGRGGSSGIESGVDQQIKASLASSAAGQLSQEQLGITEENAAIGRQNYQNAVSGMQALSGDYSPTAAGSQGTQANQLAFTQATDIGAQQAQEAKSVASLIGSAAGMAAGGMGGLSGGGDLFSNPTSSAALQGNNLFAVSGQ